MIAAFPNDAILMMSVGMSGSNNGQKSCPVWVLFGILRSLFGRFILRDLHCFRPDRAQQHDTLNHETCIHTVECRDRCNAVGNEVPQIDTALIDVKSLQEEPKLLLKGFPDERFVKDVVHVFQVKRPLFVGLGFGEAQDFEQFPQAVLNLRNQHMNLGARQE
jgi:hypothetical protein